MGLTFKKSTQDQDKKNMKIITNLYSAGCKLNLK